jgi:hypothetical protein
MKTIQDLKKNDRFKFNNTIYLVRRKWINDDKPLIAVNDDGHIKEEERFYYEGLEIEKL